MYSPVRLHVSLNGGELLEPVEEIDNLWEGGDDLRSQDPVLIQQLVHDEVHKADVGSGKPGILTQEAGELVQFVGQSSDVVSLQIFLEIISTKKVLLMHFMT